MNRQQKRKINRKKEENAKNYGFSNKECNAIDNCIRKIKHGLSCVGSIKLKCHRLFRPKIRKVKPSFFVEIP